MKRWIRKWLGITEYSGYPHRFVSLVYWHDHILGVDGNGDIWQLDFDYAANIPTVQLLTINPLQRSHHD